MKLQEKSNILQNFYTGPLLNELSFRDKYTGKDENQFYQEIDEYGFKQWEFKVMSNWLEIKNGKQVRGRS